MENHSMLHLQTGMVDFVPGRAMIDAAHRKRVKYEAKCANIGYGFIPFSFSSLGELEKDAVNLLKRIRKFSVTQDIGARALVHIFNRISFAIAKRILNLKRRKFYDFLVFLPALDLLEKQKVQAIIASESTTEAKFLAVLGDEARVPILSFSPTPSSNKHPYFLQVSQDETSQFKAIAAMAESFKWKNVILICEGAANEIEVAKFMSDTLQEKNIFVTYMSLISTSSSNELVYEELHKLSAMQTNVYIMHACHSLASRVLSKAKYLGLMDAGYKWIITSKTMDFFNFMDGEVVESIQGVVAFRSYIPHSRDLHKFTLKWRKENYDMDPMMKLKKINPYGVWAYDAVSALAMAIERTQTVGQVLKSNIKNWETSSKIRRDTSLMDQMLRISFRGLAGTFQLMNGRMSTQVLEIINVIGKRERRVGFWTKGIGLTGKIDKLNSVPDIIWPGGISTSPHRMLQTSRKTLKIGLPVRSRTGRLFNVSYDVQTKSTVVSGFCGDVFQAAFNGLRRNVAIEYIPFQNETYNDLLHRVYNGEFDAAIGDITITANRSKYVDFTLPYTDIGLAILSRNANTSIWIFMKPFSSGLWVVSACFFILTGIIVWILEHRTNEEFQGSTAEQIGTTFWFAFSTLVYAHREKLQSNLSRFVVIVWLFVVLVLVSSYTATLSSLLTIKQIQLASKGGSIGYQDGSFVQGVLVRNLNFEDNRLNPYSSPEEYADALTRGSKNGGVDAIVDEIPYIKEFLAQYPSGYSMTVSEIITNGFGFVSLFTILFFNISVNMGKRSKQAFPKGSTLAPEMSIQIAKLRQDGTLKLLEDKWFNKQLDSATAPENINLERFRGLFLISGVSMASALFLYMLYFVHE
ncbi:extracellular ligand-binding receptor [Tanacetum coccineum]